MRLSCTVQRAPVPKQRARTVGGKSGKVHSYTPEATVIGETDVWRAWHDQHERRGLEFWGDHEPVKLTVEVVLERPASSRRAHPAVRPDLDNYLKLVLDALNTWAFRDDGQVVRIEAWKRYCLPREAPHLTITIDDDLDG